MRVGGERKEVFPRKESGRVFRHGWNEAGVLAFALLSSVLASAIYFSSHFPVPPLCIPPEAIPSPLSPSPSPSPFHLFPAHSLSQRHPSHLYKYTTRTLGLSSPLTLFPNKTYLYHRGKNYNPRVLLPPTCFFFFFLCHFGEGGLRNVDMMIWN